MSTDDDFLDDAELEAWLAEEEAADRDAAHLLGDALPQARGAPAPDDLAATAERVRAWLSRREGTLGWLLGAAGFHDDLPAQDDELLLAAVAGTISPRDETGLDAEEESLLLTLERADWLGAVVELVRAGPGAPARPADLVAAIHLCPEVEVSPDVDPDDDELTESAFELATTAWLALGILDGDDRLTALGAWVLPRALARAWGSEFDGH